RTARYCVLWSSSQHGVYLSVDLKPKLRIGVRQRHACSIPGALSAHLNFLATLIFKDQTTSDDNRALGHGKREWWRDKPRRVALLPFGGREEPIWATVRRLAIRTIGSSRPYREK